MPPHAPHPGACPPQSCPDRPWDNTTARLRAIALAQLSSSSASALRTSWDLDEYFDRTFVISLPSRADRQRHLADQLRRHGSRRFEMFPAVQGHLVAQREPERWAKRLKTDEVDVLPTPEGAIGCFLSHYAVLKRAREAKLRSFLVLEDDIVFLPRAGKRFRMAMAQLPDDWDALYLGYNRYFAPARDCDDRPPSRPIGCRCSERNICPARGGLLHTHAIAYHARALDWLLPLLSKVDEAASSRLMPVDLEIRTYIEQHHDSIGVHAVLPSPLVSQNRSSQSDIYRAGMYEESGGRSYSR